MHKKEFEGVERLFLGQVLFFFSHRCPDVDTEGHRRLLAFVLVFKDIEIKRNSGVFPIYDPNGTHKVKVVGACSIENIVGLVKTAPESDRQYVCWRKGGWPKDKNGKQLQLGGLTLIP